MKRAAGAVFVDNSAPGNPEQLIDCDHQVDWIENILEVKRHKLSVE